MLFKKNMLSLNYYPPPGIAEFVNSLVSLIREKNSVIKTNVRITKIEVEKEEIKNVMPRDECITSDYVIWTAPVIDLATLLGYKKLRLFFYFSCSPYIFFCE